MFAAGGEQRREREAQLEMQRSWGRSCPSCPTPSCQILLDIYIYKAEQRLHTGVCPYWTTERAIRLWYVKHEQVKDTEKWLVEQAEQTSLV